MTAGRVRVRRLWLLVLPVALCLTLVDAGSTPGGTAAPSHTSANRAAAQSSAPQPIDLDFGAGSSQASAINDDGQVVGTRAGHAFSWTQDGGLVDLGTFGGASSAALAVNEVGQVVGHWSDGASHAFIWTQASGKVDIGPAFSYPEAINDSGQVVGWFGNTNQRHAFSWTQAGGLVDLGTFGMEEAYASDVNASGQVVGVAQDIFGGAPPVRAFSWTQAGGMVDLGNLGLHYTYVGDVNDNGQVAGLSYTSPSGSGFHAFLWTEAGGMVDLDTAGHVSQARGLSESGQIVGDRDGHPFSWTQAGGMVDLPTLGGNQGNAMDVNDDGEVVGGSTTSAGKSRAFSWTAAGGMVELAPLPGFDNSVAIDVNNNGQIVGWSWGHNDTSEIRATLWQPPLLELRALEVNQSVQDWHNAVPLVEGKATVVRAFVQTSPGSR